MRPIASRLQEIIDFDNGYKEALSRLSDKLVPANEEAPTGDRGDNIGDDESPGRGGPGAAAPGNL